MPGSARRACIDLPAGHLLQLFRGVAQEGNGKSDILWRRDGGAVPMI
jgi:hypothetical protein